MHNSPRYGEGGAEPLLGYEDFAPVIFLLPSARTAANLRKYVRAAASDEASRPHDQRKMLPMYSSLDEAWKKLCAERGIEPDFRVGRFFLFVGLDELTTEGAFSKVFRPAESYPEEYGGEEIDLLTSAEDAEILGYR